MGTCATFSFYLLSSVPLAQEENRRFLHTIWNNLEILCTAPTLLRDWMRKEENNGNEQNYLNEFLIAVFHCCCFRLFYYRKSHIFVCIHSSVVFHQLEPIFIPTSFFLHSPYILNAFVQNFRIGIAPSNYRRTILSRKTANGYAHTQPPDFLFFNWISHEIWLSYCNVSAVLFIVAWRTPSEKQQNPINVMNSMCKIYYIYK